MCDALARQYSGRRVSDEPLMTIDLLPTITAAIGGKLPEHAIDGRDVGPILRGEPGGENPHESYAFYYGTELLAVRSGDWKLVFPHTFRSFIGPPGADGKPNGYAQRKTELALYNLRDDISESKDVQKISPKSSPSCKSWPMPIERISAIACKRNPAQANAAGKVGIDISL